MTIASFESQDYHNKAYMKLLSVDNKKSPITAKIELDCEVKGTIKRKAVTVRQGDDLSEKLSGYREVYNGYVVDDIYCEKGNEYVSFTTKPEILRIGEAVGDIDDRAIKEQQIRKTIEEHLNKELALNHRGIKVLSLFFIDKVSNYRYYDADGVRHNGIYADMFEKNYQELIQRPKYRTLFQDIDLESLPHEVHGGYFSGDKKGGNSDKEWKDTSGTTAVDESAYNRIMRDMVLSSALKQAVKERIIPYNPCDNCRIPPKEKKEMTIIPPEKLGVYLSEAEKYGVLPMFFLELSSGLRRGELLALRWDDLNVKDRILSVSKQVTRIDGELVVTEPKTKNSVRKVALSQQAVDILVREHEQHPDNPILFPSPRTGGYWSPDAVSRINRKLLAKAGIEERVRFHDLRHTFATMALSSGVDVKTLSSMLGHYSAGFTLDTYTHITNDMQRGAAEKIGGFMETATAKLEPEPPDPPEESRCKVIPFERVG